MARTEAILSTIGDIATKPAFEMLAYGPRPGDFRIGLAPIALEHWFEGDLDNPAPRKDALLAAASSDVWGEMAASRMGQAEALALVRAWLRNPKVPPDGPPLLQAARLVADDLCLMECLGGVWTLTAASLCSGSFFTPAETVGKALHQLHAPVPGFNDRFLIRVARIFDRLAPATVLERRNWSVVNSDALSLPRSAPIRARIGEIGADQASAALFVRSERQTIRKLPETGSILFTIRIWREALTTILADPVRRTAFTQAWRAAMTDPQGALKDYKGFRLYDHLVAPLLS